MPIHPTAIVEPRAEVDPTAEIGPYAVVEGGARVLAGARIWHHAFVARGTTIGERCQIHPFAVAGHEPQDLKYTGAPSYTIIGAETVMREHSSVHRGTAPESTTTVGRRCFLMSCSHVGHNCTIGDDVKLANGGLLSGHCEVGNGTFISGNTSVHQFVRVGGLAMVGGMCAIAQDVPPFMMVHWRGGIIGPNTVGLRRAGLSAEARREIRQIYKLVYRSGSTIGRILPEAGAIAKTPEAQQLVEFLRAPSRRGLFTHRPESGLGDPSLDP